MKYDEKISGGLGLKDESESIEYTNYTRLKQDENDLNINIYSVDQYDDKYNGAYINSKYQVPTYKPRKKIGILIIACIALVGLASYIFLKPDSPKDKIVSEKPKVEQPQEIDDYDGKNIILNSGTSTTIKKEDTTLTSSETEAINDLIENFYDEHVYATNNATLEYVFNYITSSGPYKSEYYELYENHADKYFTLVELKVLNITKKSSNTFMVTVKDKMEVEGPQDTRLQTCKTVYEVKNVSGEFLIHSIKSETLLPDESEILYTNEDVGEPYNYTEEIEEEIEQDIEEEIVEE